MFPLRDDVPSQRFPLLTVALVATNVAVFAGELWVGPRLPEVFLELGIVPARYTIPEVARLYHPVEQAIPFFSSMFLHGGWMHMIANMWSLWIFGDNVEDRLGRLRFLALYLAGGVAAGLLHVYTNPGSVVPTIGASGAVAAVMGAYFLLYPRANVVMMVPPFVLGPYFVVPAVVFLGFWFIMQFFSGALSLISDPRQLGGIAWWAHVGGFVFGALLAGLLRARRTTPRDPWEYPDGASGRDWEG